MVAGKRRYAKMALFKMRRYGDFRRAPHELALPLRRQP
jgi:hypothetical protein